MLQRERGKGQKAGIPRSVWMVLAGTIIVAMVATIAFSLPRSGVHAAADDWPMYMGNEARQGFNGSEHTITATTAKNLKVHWTHSSGSQIASEPIVANGLLYWGSWDGLEHASNLTTGNDVWTQNLGQTASCSTHAHGVFSSTEVASVTINGSAKTVAYVGGGDAQLYALDANTGSILWHTRLGASPASFVYSSPLVYNGNVYIGISSFNDCPEIQGKMLQLDAATGTLLNSFSLVPNGCIGGGVWGSPAVDKVRNILYFASGDMGPCATTETMTSSVVALNATNLSLISLWQVPGLVLSNNYDFGDTPTLFSATINNVSRDMLGIISKNGYYYAFDRTDISAGPVWQTLLAQAGGSPDRGQGSISSSVYDGSTLYVAGAITTINGKSCAGSLNALNPNTGAVIWRLCVGHNVVGALAGAPGIVMVGAGKNFDVVNATTGKMLFKFTDTSTNGGFWAESSISNGVIYVGSMSQNVYAFGL